jgi:hypothetical protein
MLLCMAGVGLAVDQVVDYGGMSDPYAGPVPSGMRFGDVGHVSGGYYGGAGCPNCGFGVAGTPCDPCWSGPCIDWKLIGWYSNFRDKPQGCHRCGCRGGSYGGCNTCDTCGF